MNTTKQQRLEAAGWRIGSADDFLELSPEESAYVAFKLSLSQGLRDFRSQKNMTQQELARKIGSSQSRIAKAEAGDPSVSIDLLIKALFATGAASADVARLIGSSEAHL